jgi:RNA polymerase sigma-70 factor (ECF subfamily)
MTEPRRDGHENDMSHADVVPLARSASPASSAPPPSPASSAPALPALASLPPVVASREPRESRELRAAFRAMYDAHVDFVWRNLRRLGVNETDVDDKTQEVFVIAHRRFTDFEERGHGPRAWLFQIVLRVASDARRHRRRHPVDPDGGLAQERESIAPPQADAFDRREQLHLLDRALATIEVGRRAVLLLHEIEEMTAPEIADVMGIPLNTVYSRLRVARAELEDAVEQLRAGEGT